MPPFLLLLPFWIHEYAPCLFAILLTIIVFAALFFLCFL